MFVWECILAHRRKPVHMSLKYITVYMPVVYSLGFNEDMNQALSISILILDACSAL